MSLLIYNFQTSIEAFKYFHQIKTVQNETPTSNNQIKCNDFISKKEFFEGILNIFPNKFKINTNNNNLLSFNFNAPKNILRKLYINK